MIAFWRLRRVNVIAQVLKSLRGLRGCIADYGGNLFTSPFFPPIAKCSACSLYRPNWLDPKFLDQHLKNVFKCWPETWSADREVKIVEVHRAPASFTRFCAFGAVAALAHRVLELKVLTVELDMRAGHCPGVVTIKLVAKQRFSAIGFDEHMYQRLGNRHPFAMPVEYTLVVHA